MIPLCSYSVLEWLWQRVPHISIFLPYRFRRLVHLSLHIIQVHFLKPYMSHVGNCLIGHLRRWRFLLGARSIPLHSHRMASASPQALSMAPFVHGTLFRERLWQGRLLVTRIPSGPWHSLQTASGSSQALPIKRFVCGIPRRERWWQDRLLVTPVRSGPWHSRQMVRALCLALLIKRFMCGTL